MYWLWECLKLLFVGILAIIALIVINILIFGTFISFSDNNTSNTSNTNKQVVDTYTVEEQKDDTYYITSEDLQNYKEHADYVPGKSNPFEAYE